MGPSKAYSQRLRFCGYCTSSIQATAPKLTERRVQTLKPILHTLLIPNSLIHLSLANNKQLKATGWRLVGVYLSKAVTLQFLDISQNNLDKRSVEYIAAALGTITPSLPTNPNDTPTSIPSTPSAEPTIEPPLLPPKPERPTLATLRIDDCNLRYPALEVLAQAVRNSPLQHISLRNNRISSQSAVALAIMIKDYPDAITQPSQSNITPTSTPPPGSPVQGHPPPFPGATHQLKSLYASSPAASVVRQAVINQTAQATIPPSATTYTPYIPRSKRGALVAAVSQQSSTERERQVPVISTSLGGGVTTATRPAPLPNPNHPSPREVVNAAQAAARNAGPSAALLDKVRALDNLPRLGALKTLDLRGNDLRVSTVPMQERFC
jgi:protein phosphatase 1 regulatory subunit 37